MSRNTPRGIVEAPEPRCARCKKTFEPFQQDGVGMKVCPECAPNTGTNTTTDAWQYTRKGFGFRLIAGFNIMRGKSG